jgi:hypothetical protein
MLVRNSQAHHLLTQVCSLQNKIFMIAIQVIILQILA